MRFWKLPSLVALVLFATASIAPAAAADPQPYDASKYSQAVTECDRLAAHPEDPDRIAAGLNREQIDLPKAIAACEAAVKADPKNPRLNYQLGRVLGYSGRGKEAIPYRAVAVDGNYPQALFVIGYITLLGLNQQPQDTCRAGELLRRSAIAGRLAGQLGFPRYVLMGMFDQCPGVRRDKQELLGFVAAGRRQSKGDFYQGLLADSLEEDLKKLP